MSGAEFEEFKKWKDSQEPKGAIQPLNGKGEIVVVNPALKNKTLFVHLMANKYNEITTVKKKVYDTDFDYNKKTFAINHNYIINHKNGEYHYYHDILDTVGGLQFDKAHIEQCKQCGKSLSKDSNISNMLVRKRNLTPIWGIDNTHLILLAILGIGMMIALMALFYIIADDNQTHQVLQQYLPKTTTTAHLILGGLIYVK